MHRLDDTEADNVALFDRTELRNGFVFVAHAVRRHKRLVAAVLSSIVALTIAALLALPKTYHVEAKLLAQRNQVLAVRGDGPDAVAPTRGAVEMVLRRDNLIALAQATDLPRHYREHRSLSQRVAEGALRIFRGELSEEEQLDAMVDLLEKKLVAWTSEGTVSIALDWPDAKMACLLVDTAQQNFLEKRYAQEITALAESISIIGGHTARLTANIDEAVAGLAKLHGDRQDVTRLGDTVDPALHGVRAARATPVRLAMESPDLARLKLAIDVKQRVIDDLDQARRRRLAELQTRLVEQRSTYTENHPVIADLQQTILALSVPSTQVRASSNEVASLRAEYQRESAALGRDPHGASPGIPTLGPFVAPPRLPTEILRLDHELREDRDPATVYARAELRDAMDKYATLRAQVQASQIDLETAQAAFKYRYGVLTPARLPKRAVKPNVPLVLTASLVAAILASILAAIAADLRAGRLVERWQIEKLLDRPILGEMSLPDVPRQEP